jgi:hypothetical protein
VSCCAPNNIYAYTNTSICILAYTRVDIVGTRTFREVGSEQLGAEGGIRIQLHGRNLLARILRDNTLGLRS